MRTISTHTLTWSVTWEIREILKLISISTHTLTWSVTSRAHARLRRHPFQLTRSRGAWHRWLALWQRAMHFNSHAHVERDFITPFFKFLKFYFNSHAHVERDGAIKNWQNETGYFNSHAHVERDCRYSQRLFQWRRFQLTRSRGAWLYNPSSISNGKCISTHTLTWSVTFSMLH